MAISDMAIPYWRRARRGAGGRLGRYGPARRYFNIARLALCLIAAPLAADAAGAANARLLLLGDSLVAGYGLPTEDGFVAELGRALDAAGADVTLLDAGVSGDTTAGGRARLAWSLGDNPTHAFVSLGANDALRGLPPEAAKANLAAILAALKDAGVPALIVGMRAPRNWGDDYADAFDRLYPELAAETGAPLYPFFLEGVALDPALNQPDGIHPNAAGVDAIVERITPAVLDLLQRTPDA